MEFRSVKGKQINFDINKTSFEKEVKKNLSENNDKKEDLKKCPVNPNYWQNAAGIKSKNVSFGQNSVSAENAQEPDDKYIEEKLKEIRSAYYWRPPEEIDIPHKKEMLQKLSAVSVSSAENYAALSSAGIWNNDDRIRYDKLVDEFIAKIPNFDKNNLHYVKSFLLKASCNANKYDIFYDYIKTILEKENAANDDKILWLYNSFENFALRLVSQEEIEQAKQMFDGYVPLLANYDNFDEKLALIKMKFSPEEVSQCCNLIESGSIEASDLASKAQDIVKFVYYDKDSSVSKLKEMLNDLSSDSEKVVLYNKLMNKSFSRIGLPVNMVLPILKGPVSFYNKLFDGLLGRTSENEYVFNTMDGLSAFVSIITEDNYDDFLNSTKNMSSSSAVFNALDSINPKTKLYDSKIGGKIAELESRGVSNYYARPIAFSCIDGITGKFSPVADEILDFILKSETDKKSIRGKALSIVSNFSSKARNITRMKSNMEEYEIFDIIDCVKNNEGGFEKRNWHYLKKFLSMKDNSYGFFSLAEFMKLLKDKNGVIPKNSFLYAADLMKKTNSFQSVLDIIKIISTFPEDKRENVINTISGFSGNAAFNLHYFPVFSEYCFDKDGNEKPENIAFVRKLSGLKKNLDYNSEFFNMCELSEDNKNFSIEIIKSSGNEFFFNLYSFAKLFNEYKEGDVFPEDIKQKIRLFASKDISLDLFDDTYKACSKNGKDKFDEDLFYRIIDLMEIESKQLYMNNHISGSLYADILNDSLDLSLLNFKDKINLMNALKGIKDYAVSINSNDYDFLNKTIADLDAGMSLDNISLPITGEVKSEFLQNVIKSDASGALTPFEKTLADSIPLLKSFKFGLPISYPRESFLTDLSDLCKDESMLELIKTKTGITPIFTKDGDDINITGYDGIIALNELNTDNPQEKQIYNLMYQFLYENQVVSGNTELDEQLNYIIKACPEFINTIGKKQHDTHEYTLDIHSLLVLANSISDPAYGKNLNSVDKSLLKLAAIFHDLIKKENEIDKGHQNQSSLYARSIVKKFFNNPEKRDRLYEIIRNHHWLEEYSTASDKDLKAKELAFRFRRPNDFEVAKIMARADLQAVSDSFYEAHKDALDVDNLVPVDNYLNFLYSTGNAIFSDYIVAPGKLKSHTKEKDGREYRVINFHNIAPDEDMLEYGFLNGVKKKDIKFLVHMVDSNQIYNSLNTVKLLASPYNGGVLSESLITPKYKKTYCDRKYGVVLSQINPNIVNENSTNQASGNQKDFTNLLNLIYGYEKETRLNFRRSLLENLGINSDDVSDEEYGKFYREVIASKTALSQISPSRKFKIGDNIISGQDLIDAIVKYQDSLIDKQQNVHNEIVGYTPKIQAVIAETENFDEVPDELLQFAYENNYPVILI